MDFVHFHKRTLQTVILYFNRKLHLFVDHLFQAWLTTVRFMAYELGWSVGGQRSSSQHVPIINKFARQTIQNETVSFSYCRGF